MHNIEFYLLSLEIIHASASCLVYESIMSIISWHPVYLDNIYVNYFIPTYFRKTSYSFVMSSCLTRHHILNDILPILFFITFPFVDNVCTLNYSSCESAIGVGDWKIWSENKAFRAGNGTCWSIYLDGYKELLRGGFTDRWPVLYTTWGVCSKLQCLYFSYHAYGVLHCLV